MVRQQQSFSCCFTLNKKIQWPDSITCDRDNSSVCCEIGVATKTANKRKQSEIILNQQKPSETTQKPSKTTCTNGTPQPTHRAMSHQILPCFFAVDFEHDFIISKVGLQKHGKNLVTLMNRKGKLWTLSQNSEKSLQNKFTIYVWSRLHNI